MTPRAAAIGFPTWTAVVVVNLTRSLTSGQADLQFMTRGHGAMEPCRIG